MANREWLVPLTGVVFIVLLFVGFAVGGEPPTADDPVQELVDFYLDDKDSIQIGAILGVVAGVFLIYFGGYLRRFLRAATGDESSLPQIAFLGLVIVAIGGAIDGTLSFAMSEAADDIEPATLQGIQAIWDNDFLPLALGILCFLLGHRPRHRPHGGAAQVAGMGDPPPRGGRPHAHRLRFGDRCGSHGAGAEHLAVRARPSRIRPTRCARRAGSALTTNSPGCL